MLNRVAYATPPVEELALIEMGRAIAMVGWARGYFEGKVSANTNILVHPIHVKHFIDFDCPGHSRFMMNIAAAERDIFDSNPSAHSCSI